MASRPSFILVLACAVLSACGARIGGGSSALQQAAVEPASSPPQRAVQVAWTAASARYCAFGLNPEKLKADYLAWETKNGAPPDTVANLGSTYDKAFMSFYDKAKETPDYCTKSRIEEIRPEINRHLAGDYEPKKKAAPKVAAKPNVRIREDDNSLDRVFIPKSQ